MKIRYVGPDPEVLLSIPGASLTCPKGEWIDAERAAEDAFVPAIHMLVVVRGLVGHPYWDVEGYVRPKPPKRPRRARQPKAPAVAPISTEPTPPEPDGSPPADPASDEQEQDT